MQWLCRKEIVLEWIEISYSFWSFPSTYFSNGRENWNLITWLIFRRHGSADYQIDKRGWQSTDLLLDLTNYSQNTSLTSHMDCGQHDPSWDREDQTDQTQTQTTSHLPPTWRMLRGAGDRSRRQETGQSWLCGSPHISLRFADLKTHHHRRVEFNQSINHSPLLWCLIGCRKLKRAGQGYSQE